jgi:predicted protein tyrosine phosphatase
MMGMTTSSKTTLQLKTSATDPLRVDFVRAEAHGLPGRIGLTIAPGKKDSSRGWDRDLETDLRGLREAHGACVLVSLMERHEHELLGIPDLLERALAMGIDVRWFPIQDVSVPEPGRIDAFVELIDGVEAALHAGRTVVVHCRGGLGRSGTVAACLLLRRGLHAARAIAEVRAARPGAVEGPQAAWIAGLAGRLRPAGRAD